MNAACATLVFDGDCAICRSWVSYWQRLTNGRVTYRLYQEAAADFPIIAHEAFERAIWLIEPDGRIYSGAAVAYRVLLYAPGHAGWWWMYTRLTGFAAASEWTYTFFARHRDLLSCATHLLWGPVHVKHAIGLHMEVAWTGPRVDPHQLSERPGRLPLGNFGSCF